MKLFRSTMVAMASAVALSIAAAIPAQASTPVWRVVLTRHYGPPTNYSSYTTTVVSGKDEAWVFGSTDANGAPTPGLPVAELWNGKKWLASQMPRGTTGTIQAASVVSSKSIWGVTDIGGYIVHWNGSRWLVAKHLPGGPPGELILSGVTAVNDHDVWVFGTGAIAAGYGSWHYNGHTWSRVTGIASAISYASASSASNIWGVDSYGSLQGEIVRYNGHTWQNMTPKALKGLIFIGTLTQSATSVWITADTYAGTTRLIHFSSGRWIIQKLPWTASALRPPMADGSGGFWVPATSGTQNWLWHRSAKGQWSRLSVSFPAWSFAPVPGTASLLLPGGVATKTGSNAVLWVHGSLP
jgi:hypothetical protein